MRALTKIVTKKDTLGNWVVEHRGRVAFEALRFHKDVAQLQCGGVMTHGDFRSQMANSDHGCEEQTVERAIALAEAALHHCDEHGFFYAAIDLSSAIDKLKAIKAEAEKR